MGERSPRVQVTRQVKRVGMNYYDPYTQIWAVRKAINLLSRVYPVRICTLGAFQRARARGRPYLLVGIEKCSVSCVG